MKRLGAAAVSLLVAACTPSEDPPEPAGDGPVPVEFDLRVGGASAGPSAGCRQR